MPDTINSKQEFKRQDITQDQNNIKQTSVSDNLEFDWEFYFELIDVDGKKLEHVWFRSDDWSFEDMMNNLPEMMKLPQRAKIKVIIEK